MRWDSSRFNRPVLTKLVGKLPRRVQRETYLVGGAVRDLILKRAVVDFDIVTNCPPGRFISRMARALHSQATTYPEFFTASLVNSDEERFDFSQMRREVYPKPAALPLVHPSNMLWDLFRRDFTVNAMAVNLGPPDRGRLFDPFGGLADLLARRIRVMHDSSFIDDPTRIFRAVRYACRLGFKIEPETKSLIKQAVGRRYHHLLSGERIKHELELVLREPTWRRILGELHRLRLFSAPDRIMRSLAKVRDDKLLYLIAMTRSPLLKKCPLSRIDSAIVRGIRNLAKLQRSLAHRRNASQLYFALKPVRAEVTAILALLGPRSIRTRVCRFKKIEKTVPLLTGRDLIMLGVKPGKAYQQILRHVLSLQLDGRISSRSAAKKIAKTYLCPSS